MLHEWNIDWFCDRNLIADCSNWLWKGWKFGSADVKFALARCIMLSWRLKESVKDFFFFFTSVFFSSGILEGLPEWHPECGGVQENLCQFLPLRWRLQVRWARLPNFWHQWRWYDRLPGVHHRLERDVTRQAGAEAEMGIQHVWSWRKRVHQPRGDAGDCTGEQGTLSDKNWLIGWLGAKDEMGHLEYEQDMGYFSFSKRFVCSSCSSSVHRC